jgi:hypothetical protein
MQIKMDETKDPVSGESGLLLLVVLGICGLLMWWALFLGVRWSVSNACELWPKLGDGVLNKAAYRSGWKPA